MLQYRRHTLVETHINFCTNHLLQCHWYFQDETPVNETLQLEALILLGPKAVKLPTQERNYQMGTRGEISQFSWSWQSREENCGAYSYPVPNPVGAWYLQQTNRFQCHTTEVCLNSQRATLLCNKSMFAKISQLSKGPRLNYKPFNFVFQSYQHHQKLVLKRPRSSVTPAN